MAVAAATAPTHDSEWIVTASTVMTVTTSATDAQVIDVVSRACTSTARWNAIHTEPAGSNDRICTGRNANAESSGGSPEMFWNQMDASGV